MRKTTCIKKYYSASITVEASIILSVVLLSLAAFIRYAYTVHDTVTGSMILEETLERARNNVNEKKTIDSFEQEGSQMGNPRLYLGAYELHLNLGALTAEGDAAAGDWSLVMLHRLGINFASFFLKVQIINIFSLYSVSVRFSHRY